MASRNEDHGLPRGFQLSSAAQRGGPLGGGCIMYSQGEEEKYILEAVGASGHFLDFGAFDGRTFSNTLALVERGWSGVLVEPSCYAFRALLELHGTNDKLRLVQALVGVNRGLVPFWNSADAISTTETKSYAIWKQVADYKPLCYVPELTVKDIIAEFPVSADMVNIDTEGTSARLFIHWPIEICVPKVFCVEHDKQQEEITSKANLWGYKTVYENQENMVLVRDAS
jgi:hypothetical protein